MKTMTVDSSKGHFYLNMTEGEAIGEAMAAPFHMPMAGSLMPADETITRAEYTQARATMEMMAAGEDPNSMSPSEYVMPGMDGMTAGELAEQEWHHATCTLLLFHQTTTTTPTPRHFHTLRQLLNSFS